MAQISKSKSRHQTTLSIHIKKGSDLTSFFGDLSQSEKLFEIKPPLGPHIFFPLEIYLLIKVFTFLERVINCQPASENAATKPLNMIAMEAESLKLRSEKMYQAELFQGDSGPGSVRIEIKPVGNEGVGKL